MSVTHNEFKAIEKLVFSQDSYSFDKERLDKLRGELLVTHDDATQNNQILERWHSVNERLTTLINEKEISKNHTQLYRTSWLTLGVLFLTLILGIISLKYGK